ncbi:flagellar motor protein MotB [candidate division KSB1 bacterium]
MSKSLQKTIFTVLIIFIVAVIPWVAYYYYYYLPNLEEEQSLQTEVIELRETNDRLRSELEELEEHFQSVVKDTIEQKTIAVVNFASGFAYLDPEAKKTLKDLVLKVRVYPRAKLQIIGYSDTKPIATKLRSLYPTNWDLSYDRALEVVKYLRFEGEINPAAFEIIGRSVNDPFAPNDTKSGRIQNRRVEVVLISKK